LLFSRIKEEFGFEEYLGKIQNKGRFLELTQIIIGAHNLRMETGHHTEPPRENRICLHCESNCIEEEAHFMFQCEKFTVELEWKPFLNVVTLSHPEFSGLSLIEDKLTFLLNNPDTLSRTASFSIYAKRS
jgi:hypothetical protein